MNGAYINIDVQIYSVCLNLFLSKIAAPGQMSLSSIVNKDMHLGT